MNKHVYTERGLVADIKSEQGFYVGDICYVLGDDVYGNVWGDVHNYEDGQFEVPGTGLSFAVYSTADGDGEYCDVTRAYSFPVDAGVIGIVPLELVPEEKLQEAVSCGRIYLDETEAHFEAEMGKFWIQVGSQAEMMIDTGDADEEDDYLIPDDDEEDEV